MKKFCRKFLLKNLGGPGIPGDLRDFLYRDFSWRFCEEILKRAPVKRSRRSRDIRRSSIEIFHMGVLRRDLVKSSCKEISQRGFVKRSCRELFYRDLS